ncbi:MAG TPA: hypothetical protein VFH56_13935, partial [Acidimicrobiales bacterium]|nr:hypothetical protein [Acidimicrobiales bacterium]
MTRKAPTGETAPGLSLRVYLASFPDRCPHGFHPAQAAIHQCADLSEWAIFTAALRDAAKGGRVHQADVRPLIRG